MVTTDVIQRTMSAIALQDPLALEPITTSSGK
eukprot:CAMPEP_0172428204 /NCGR_PEP_ID=MMETSP1064-20121228/45471_1 /TAXON_ID=202472 /ORGANISM="Aulacoseira subarctica , Strain CCAP 1002/5" /LENGTH=31 /DNA_ID= /DNA_START= /DNA_END= /DNA_ORIENTATION=